MRLISILFIAAFFTNCGNKSERVIESEISSKDSVSTELGSEYTMQIIAAPENTFGYDILKNNTPFIHQPHIPGLPGIKGFEREVQAKKAAELMITKLKDNIIPPTISEDELKMIMNN